MPTREWSLRSTNTAKFGLNWSQSGDTLYVTVQKWRTSSAYNNFARTLAVTVTGNSTVTTGSSTDQSFPSGMATNSWMNTDVAGWAFTLPTGVSSVSVRVVWSQPATDGWINQDHTESIPITPVYDVPTAPTAVAATRISDLSASLAWTRHATVDGPYTSQEAYRSENGGAAIDTAALSGSATTYTVTTAANKKYTFQIESRNSAGQSRSLASDVLLTTPAAITSLVGVKVSGGIRLTFAKLTVPYTEAQILLEYTNDDGDSWSTAHTFDAVDLSTVTSTDWTDTGAPSSGTVQYRATVKTNGGTQGVLSSAVKMSNILVLNTPPLAPTNLTPSGLVDVASSVPLVWSHTPSSDGAVQSSRQVQYSTDSGATQTDIVTGDSTAESYAWAVSTGSFTAGQTIQWRVRTAGSQPGTYGAWSAWQTITLRASLSVTITDPSGTWEGGDIPVEWTTTESWGSASQVAYRIIMATATAIVYDSGTVTSAALTGTIPAAAQSNLTDYTITVTVTDNYGLTSLPDSELIDTDFLAPGPVGLTWEYDDDLGQLVLTPEFSEETSSELDDTTSWMVERSVDGATWTVLGIFNGDGPVPDAHVLVGAASRYRTTGYTELGVAGEQTIYTVPRADVASRWGWLAYGDSYESQVRFGWAQTVDISSGRASDVHDIEGVDFAAAVFGQQQSEKYTISGKLLYKNSPDADGIPDSLVTASAEDMRTLAKTAAVCLFRDGNGAWWTARVSDMKVSPKRRIAGQPDEAAVSFTVERVTA